MSNAFGSLFKRLAIFSVFSAILISSGFAEDSRAYAVEVSATAQTSPPQIALRWPTDFPNTAGYSIYRKGLSASSWTLMASLPATASGWTDQSVAIGSAYEYYIQKRTSAGYTGTGYIYAGINAPMTENRGKVVLVVDNTYALALSTELARLQEDLVGDGWTVLRHDVSREDSPVLVKNIIKADYQKDPANVKSVFLFGHVPVPYSGNFNPDGHLEHKGAWVADTYYGDMDGTWTDSTVNNTTAEKPWNRNVPGDGKFDQSDLPSDIELQVGRVDLANLTCYSNKTPSRSELDLLRAYLNKDHAFRHGQLTVPRRGLVCDNFGEMNGEAFATTGWRSFAPLFGAENNSAPSVWGDHFPLLKNYGYLWAYGTGAGSYTSCHGIGYSDDFAVNDIKAVFTAYLGSYFGDWDNESNFLRASLGSGYVLATAWAGRPHWFFHHMGLGETIGYSAKVSQNNRYGGLYAVQNHGTRNVHITLLGDPTLRLHPVIPPSNVTATMASGVNLAWTASSDANVQGYAIYRAASANGSFVRINGNLTTGTTFADAAGSSVSVYMIRAVKLETSGSGTYLNPSQGAFASVTSAPTPTPAPTGSATFVGKDTTTRGSWKAIYGSDGYLMTQVRTNLPSYASVTQTGGLPWVWAAQSTSPNAMETIPGPSRTAACWYSPSSISINVNLSDNQTHRVALYLDDDEPYNRQEVVEVYDLNGALLGSHTLTSFTSGVYSIWDLKGSVRIKVRNLGGRDAVISGIFFGSTGYAPVGSSSSAVRFLGTDATTRGSWKGVFGSQGFQVIGNTAQAATFASVTAAGKSDYVWNPGTTEVYALQKASGTDRIAACWYGSLFDVNINITDGQTHKISFYAIDWGNQGRAEKIEVLDGSGKVLQTINLSNFQAGTYLSYDVKGSVTFRFTQTGPGNAVVSGYFFDPPTSPL